MRRLEPPTASSPFRHILVAVDATTAADNAVRLSLALVHGDPSATVTFCNVLDVPRMIARAMSCLGDYAGDFKTAREAARARLEPFKTLARQRGIAAQTCVRYGNAATEIAAFAGLIQADLIVIGNRSTTKLHRLLCGSTRDALVRTSRVPVLIADGEGLRALRFRPQCILMAGAAECSNADGTKQLARMFARTFAARLISAALPDAGVRAQMTALDEAVRDYRPGLIVVPLPLRRPLGDFLALDPLDLILRKTHIPVMVAGGASATVRV